ncbi:ATP-dependent DNA helicase recQ [Sporolactobacillus inulinus]|uniref:ATP-dependent DNA helicase recQ n=1 Tax=Sporolactobacillus inulinus TaxID=2078 RepID=A0A4Y1ZF80_9BACL|nr:hypothetical protein [Sporolactobacillus inulinus]GAY77826.1 ATP-dependent DNA helicase recQ [Sporolactobacillus inulinus]
MGINKQDIRLIVHFHFPSSMNAYLQEIGRASRDGKQGLAVLFYTKSDEQLPEGFIDGNFPSDEMLHRVLLQLDQGTRSLADKNEFMSVLMEEGVSETAARFLFEHASEKPIQQTYSSLLDPCRMRIKERVAVQVNDLSIMKTIWRPLPVGENFIYRYTMKNYKKNRPIVVIVAGSPLVSSCKGYRRRNAQNCG